MVSKKNRRRGVVASASSLRPDLYTLLKHRSTKTRHSLFRALQRITIPMKTYTNPVYAHDFPDPHVLEYQGKFYAYATETRGFRFQVMESPDLVHWTHKGTALATVPWANVHYWAPEVAFQNGVFYMTYSALNPDTRKHDIAIATAKSPLGPFTHQAILVRAEENRVGVIDATLFFDYGIPYLVYSEEDPRSIVLRRLSSNLKRVEGGKVRLIRPDQEWERGVVEAPTILRRDGLYHLFYSGGWFQSDKKNASYSVAHAAAPSLTGKYIKTGIVLGGDGQKVFGPGHQCIVSLKSGEDWLLYHGWDDQNEPRYGSNPLGRTLRLDRLRWKLGAPIVEGGASTTPRPAPRV